MRVNLVSFPITFSVPLDCQEVIHLFYLHCWKLFDLNRRCLVSFGAIGEESSWPLQGKQDEKWQLALLLRKAELVAKIRQREQRTKNKGRVTVTATVWWVTKAELVTKTVSPALRHGLCDQLGLWAAPEFWQRQGLVKVLLMELGFYRVQPSSMSSTLKKWEYGYLLSNVHRIVRMLFVLFAVKLAR